ncbi:TonB family protein [Marinimicrobium alkaliphilum]|uniref:TonB family protein n=1 Tax=Marinimicrobium alkaliphilum TaxID=2202654 RepID=UPI000DBA881C
MRKVIRTMNRYLIAVFLVFVTFHLAAQEAIEEVEPRYPMPPICKDDSGVVRLSFNISSEGTPENIEIVEATSLRFVRSSIKAMEAHKFKVGTFSTDMQYFKEFNFEPEHTCN